MKITKKVTVYNANTFEYPTESPYNPSKKYPEYPFEDVNINENNIYDSIREMFLIAKLDFKNRNKIYWNPLREYIRKGDTVLIKPNIVNHFNELAHEGIDCVITNGSIIRALLDYVYIATGPTGKIIIGDAPIQFCNFNKANEKNGLDNIIEYYRIKGINISLIDFRLLKEGNEGATNVNIGTKSFLKDIYSRKLSITNYDPREIKRYHNKENHIYSITNSLLEADVVINIPKPKTHRKAGMTGAMKNLIGINARKECLAHHSKGSVKEDGDEYLHKDKWKKIKSKLLDRLNIAKYKNNKFKIRLYSLFLRKIERIITRNRKDSFYEGSWYGNDTIWRTICDVNYIAKYADKNGSLKNKPQRKIISIGDMIISGEKEGPLSPTSKKIGYLIFSDDIYDFDIVVGTLMGFDYKKIKYLKYYESERNPEEIIIQSNEKKYNERKIKEIQKSDTFNFIASKGWKDHIEME